MAATMAQKTMGIITSLLGVRRNPDTFKIPLWVVLLGASAIALGNLKGRLAYRKNHGTEDYQTTAYRRFLRGNGQASRIHFYATHMGVPVATTHVITGAILE